MLRDTRLLVDLDAIAHNIGRLVAFLDATAPAGTRRPRLACVLKADAYGLGARRVAGLLVESGIDLLAVACLTEAVELRRRFGETDIFVMGHVPTAQFGAVVENRIIATVFDESQAAALSEAARDSGTRARIHIKVDSGMNRLGIKTGPGAAAQVARIASFPGLAVEGIFTHLALENETSDRLQFSRFTSLLDEAETLGCAVGSRHVCDSIGLARYPEFRLDLVRPGAILFGVPPQNSPLLEGWDFRLPLSFRSRITRLRRLVAGEGVGYDCTWKAPEGGALVATVCAGYGDGYPRSLSNLGEVLVRGSKAPVIGLVCMDQLNLDLSSIPGAAEGDEVVLFGSAGDGGLDSGIPLLETSRKAATNRNELLASISRRVPRVYRRAGASAGHVDYVLGEETYGDRI